jgi:hypothetical protein
MEETYTVSWMIGGFDVVSDWQVFESFYDEILRDEKLVTANISKNIDSTEWY